MAGLGEHLTELLKGSLIVDKGLLVMWQVPRVDPEVKPVFVKDARSNEPLPLEGAEDGGGKGLVNEDGLAKVAAELISRHYPVVVQFIMQLGSWIVRIPKAFSGGASLGKAADFLKGNYVKVNPLI
jgi:hypothetical protein